MPVHSEQDDCSFARDRPVKSCCVSVRQLLSASVCRALGSYAGLTSTPYRYSRTSCRLPRTVCSSVVTGAWGRNDAAIRHHTLQKLEEVTISRKDEGRVFGDDRLV